MKAVLLEAYGGVDQLRIATVPRPEPERGEVLVRIHATSLNPIDWKMRNGSAKDRFPLDLPAILGRDLAGEVVGLGPGVDSDSSGLTHGQRVMALANHTYAEYAAVPADTLAAIPDALSYERAGSLPLVLLTGAQLAERAARVERGQTVLVTGALGSVGRTAVFVAQQHGARVIAGVRKSQLEEAKALQAAYVVALDDDDTLAAIKDLDAVADTIGGDLAAKLLPLIKPGGIYASVVGPPKDAGKFNVRVQPMMAQPDAKRLGELAQAIAAGEFDIPIAEVLPLTEVRKAHELGEKGGANGKIVLIP